MWIWCKLLKNNKTISIKVWDKDLPTIVTLFVTSGYILTDTYVEQGT